MKLILALAESGFLVVISVIYDCSKSCRRSEEKTLGSDFHWLVVDRLVVDDAVIC